MRADHDDNRERDHEPDRKYRKRVSNRNENEIPYESWRNKRVRRERESRNFKDSGKFRAPRYRDSKFSAKIPERKYYRSDYNEFRSSRNEMGKERHNRRFLKRATIIGKDNRDMRERKDKKESRNQNYNEYKNNTRQQMEQYNHNRDGRNYESNQGPRPRVSENYQPPLQKGNNYQPPLQRNTGERPPTNSYLNQGSYKQPKQNRQRTQGGSRGQMLSDSYQDGREYLEERQKRDYFPPYNPPYDDRRPQEYRDGNRKESERNERNYEGTEGRRYPPMNNEGGRGEYMQRPEKSGV